MNRRGRTASTSASASVLAASGAALAILALAGTAGCDAVDQALDCAQFAADVTADVDRLQESVSGADENPQAAVDALNDVEKELNDFGDQADNADTGAAVDDMQRAVDNAQQAADQGELPDLQPVTDAAAELTKVCTP